MKHPASIVQGKWIFGVVIALGALGATSGWAQSESALPSGVSVRLEPKGERTDYLMGEPINMTLSFSADHPGYLVDTERIFGVSERFNVTPAVGYFTGTARFPSIPSSSRH
jgi:hypothetical protein